MKKTNLFMMIFACAALLTGCDNDNGNDDGGDPQTYSVTVTYDDHGTARTDKTTAEAGAIVELTATADSGYDFKQWVSVSGDVTLTDPAANPATFTMPAGDVAFKAEFSAIAATTYTITVTYDEHGTAQSDKTTAEAGATVELTATADSGYDFKQWVSVSGNVTLTDPAANPATFTMPAGDVAFKAEFEQAGPAGTIQPESNSYMVAPNSETILIPVSRANKAADEEYNLGADATGLGGVTADNFTAELVWGDTPIGANGVIKKLASHTYGGEGYILVEPGVAGNTVICVKVDGEIKWSWHIWVTEKVGKATDSETGLAWMDRNLGAAGTTWDADGKNGLFYQWGRKDAFPGSKGSNAVQDYYSQAGGELSTDANPTGEYTSLPELVKNPLNMAINNTTYYGSVSTADTANDSWGAVSGKKTIYDPCPAGWRVPPIKVDEVNSWGSNNATNWDAPAEHGRTFKGVDGVAGLTLFFPSNGYRVSDTGAFNRVDQHTTCWSADGADGANGYDLYANNYNKTLPVTPAQKYARTYGFGMRCVEE